jgi:hypothetical protein
VEPMKAIQWRVWTNRRKIIFKPKSPTFQKEVGFFILGKNEKRVEKV